MPEAARHLDEISHSHAELGFWLGTIGAAIVEGVGSYLIGAGLSWGLAGLACIFPFGTIAAVGIGLLLGWAASTYVVSPAADFVQSAGEAAGGTFTYVTGTLNAIGSANIKINKRVAFRAHNSALDYADCSDHPSPKHSPVAEGATNVWFNCRRAARKGDAVDCDAKISSGSENVMIGTPPLPVLKKRNQEISDWEREAASYLRIAAGIIGGAAGSLKDGIGCFGANIAIAVGITGATMATGLGSSLPHADYGKKGGSAFGGWLGNAVQGKPIHVPSGAKFLTDEVDAYLPAPLPLIWSRYYNSKDARTGILGKGWSTPDFMELVFHEGEITFYGPNGRDLRFKDIEAGEKIYYVDEQFQVYRAAGGAYYIAYPKIGEVLEFGARASFQNGERLVLQVLADLNGNCITYERDQSGLLRTISASNGLSLNLYYKNIGDFCTRLAHVTMPMDDVGGQKMLACYSYSEHGDLISVTDESGLIIREFAYQQNMMVMQRLATGLRCYYEWDRLEPKGRVVNHWMEDGESYQFFYGPPDEYGNYDVSCIDNLNAKQFWTCNKDQNVVAYTNPLGQIHKFEWNAWRLLIAYVSPQEERYSFAYDGRGQLASVVNPLGLVTRAMWEDRYGLISMVVESDGSAWCYSYDDAGNLTEIMHPDGLTENTVYNEVGLPVMLIDAKGGVKRINYNNEAQVVQFTDCSGQSTHYEYNNDFDLVEMVDAKGFITNCRYDKNHRLQAVQYADSAIYQYGYDLVGQTTYAVDPLGRQVNWTYDRRGRLAQQQDPEGRIVALHYDNSHNLSHLVNENGESFQFIYDAANRMVEELRVGGTRVTVERNANGWPIAVTHYPAIGDDILSAAGDTTAGQTPEITGWGDVSSDAQGKLRDLPIRTELVRDAIGRLVEKRTAQYHFHYHYDAASRLTKATKSQVIASELDQQIDPRIQLQPLHTTNFGYDLVGNLISEEAIDERTGERHNLCHSHDELDNRTQTMLPGDSQVAKRQALHYLYYGSGHLHQINYSLQSGDHLTGSEAHQLICDLDRDELHQEVLRSQGELNTRRSYDPVGRLSGSWTRAGMAPPAFQGIPGADSAFAQAMHLEHGAGQLLKQYQYDKTGELIGSRHSHQGATAYRYDATGRVLQKHQQTLSGAHQTAANESFGYDPAGNIQDAATQQTVQNATALSQRGYVRDNLVRVFEDKRFFYDGHGRLIQKLAGKHTAQTFVWDEENRLTQVTTTRRPGTEHESIQVSRFDYDAIGRRVAKHDMFGTTRFIWEGMRLLQERRGTSIITYVYEPGSYIPLARLDEDGERAEQGGLGTTDDAQATGTTKTIAASARQTSATDLKHSKPAANDTENQYWASLNEAAHQTAQAQHIEGWGTGTHGIANSSTTGQADLCKVYYFHTDQVGMPQELTNAQGQLVWQASYKTWGNTVTEEWQAKTLSGNPIHSLDAGDTPDGSANQQQNLRYQGQYLDRDTGLHYNTFRYYDPDMGRFICPDPIGLDGGVNLQSYAPNPFGWIDPLGWCHANSKNSTREQHGYEILDTHQPGSPVVKTGVGSGPLNKNGTSARANKQVNKWNREPGNTTKVNGVDKGRYEARIAKQEPSGAGARERILKWEEKNANANRATLDPNRHKRP